MNRTVASLLAIVVLIAAVATPLAAASGTWAAAAPAVSQDPPTSETATATESTSDETSGTGPATNEAAVSPGAQLSGVVGVQRAEVEGELSERKFGIRVARAATNGSTAAVVSTQLRAVERRLSDLRSEKAFLQRARRNGTVDRGEYAARMATIAARVETTKRLIVASAAVSERLPADALASRGVNASAIARLSDAANDISGAEVAAIARSVAGAGAGQRLAGRPDDPDASDDERIAQAVASVSRARQYVTRAHGRVGDRAGDAVALSRANESVQRAEAALEAARNASEAGDIDRAMTLSAEAIDHAERATRLATNATNATDGADARDNRR